MVAEICFLLARSGFDPALTLQFNERGVVALPFALQEQIGAVSSLFRRSENVPASLAVAALIRLSERTAAPLLPTTDTDVQIDNRHRRQTNPLLSP